MDLASEVDQALQDLATMGKPVVAGVQGAVAGAGLAVMLSADLVLAAESMRFLTAYAGVGLTPDCGLSWLLPRAIGSQRALELALTGRVLTAAESHAWGLITTVVPDDELAQQSRAVVVRLAAAPPFAMGQARRLIRQSWTSTRAETGADEARTIAHAATTTEAQQLIGQFLAR
ncbi:MAG: enoyl-CoA hydratase-related protein [Tetrasphaera sp.]